MPRRFSPQCVLIADDDQILCEILEEYFTQRDIPTFNASNGYEAKQFIENHSDQIDLIICDLNMPDFDGIEFLQYLRSGDLQQKLIIVSGADQRIVNSAVALAKSYSLNLIDVFAKPIDFERFKSIFD